MRKQKNKRKTNPVHNDVQREPIITGGEGELQGKKSWERTEWKE
jgi:hypothetical protein